MALVTSGRSAVPVIHSASRRNTGTTMNQPAAELDEEEQIVDRLRRWHRELRSRDVFDSVDLATIAAKIDACSAELERFTGLVYRTVGLD